MVYYTDAAAKYGDWNILPEKCMVIQARVITPNGSEWTDLSTITSSSIMKTVNINLSDSKLCAKISEARRGNNAFNARADYNNHKSQEEYIETLSKRLACQIDSFSISNLDNTSENFKMDYIQTSDVSLGDDFLYINPLVEKLFSDNPFKGETRVFPIQFNHLSNYIQVINFKIPEGYAVEEVPKGEKLVFNDNDISFIYRVATTEKEVKIHYQYQLKKLLFLPSEYAYLQDYIAKIISKSAEQIVLKKI